MIHYPNPIQSRQHTLEDGMNMSKGGLIDASSHKPTHSDENRVQELHYRASLLRSGKRFA